MGRRTVLTSLLVPVAALVIPVPVEVEELTNPNTLPTVPSSPSQPEEPKLYQVSTGPHAVNIKMCTGEGYQGECWYFETLPYQCQNINVGFLELKSAIPSAGIVCTLYANGDCTSATTSSVPVDGLETLGTVKMESFNCH